jgi:hypothetical protein
MNKKTRIVTPNKVGIREISLRMMYLVNRDTPSHSCPPGIVRSLDFHGDLAIPFKQGED